MAEHPEALGAYYPVLDASMQVNALGGGDTGAPQVKANPIAKEWYHTDWVADRTMAWLDTLAEGDDWFAWMSFPDPHHPWDPPESEMRRIDWREVPLPEGYPQQAEARERISQRQAASLVAVVRRHPGLELRGPRSVGTGHPHRRSGA